MNNTPTTTLALPPPRLTLIEEIKQSPCTLARAVKLHRAVHLAIDYNLKLGADWFRRREPEADLCGVWQQFKSEYFETQIFKASQ